MGQIRKAGPAVLTAAPPRPKAWFEQEETEEAENSVLLCSLRYLLFIISGLLLVDRARITCPEPPRMSMEAVNPTLFAPPWRGQDAQACDFPVGGAGAMNYEKAHRYLPS
jgi:hypothetical protein